MEVCVNSLDSAVNAEKGGAIRVELCANLMEGGTTPSVGMLRVVKSLLKIPVFVMIRPRGGDFCYSIDEFQVMKEDIISLKKEGADGFVFGLLTSQGDVDEGGCNTLKELCHPLPTTFHRAIDMSRDIFDALARVIKLGFTRVLTSGGHDTALTGAVVIRQMIHKAHNEIQIMPGGGITVNNLAEILRITEANEFHGTARQVVDSVSKFRKMGVTMGSVPDTEYIRKVSSPHLVASLVKIFYSYGK